MTDDTHPTSDDSNETTDGALTPKRRKLLGSLGAAAGVASLANPVSGGGKANTVDCGADGRVRTRGCSDEALTSDDWSTGAVTAQACPDTGGRVLVEVTGRVGTDREHPPEQTNTTDYPNTREATRTEVTQNQTAEVTQEQISCGDGSTQEQTIIIEQHQTTIVRPDAGPIEGAASDASRALLDLRPGEKLTVWYTGQATTRVLTNSNINIAMAERVD